MERQREGIAIAKRKGKYKGGQPKKVKDFDVWYEKYRMRKINKVEFSKGIHVSRPTLDKLIRQHEEQLADEKK